MWLDQKLNDSFRIGKYVGKIENLRILRKSYSAIELENMGLFSPTILHRILDTMDAHPEWDDDEVAQKVNFRESVMRRTIR